MPSRIQIAVALIAFLLLRLAQATQTAVSSPLAFARLVRANLMHRRRIDRLLKASRMRASIRINWHAPMELKPDSRGQGRGVARVAFSAGMRALAVCSRKPLPPAGDRRSAATPTAAPAS